MNGFTTFNSLMLKNPLFISKNTATKKLQMYLLNKTSGLLGEFELVRRDVKKQKAFYFGHTMKR